MPLFPGSFYSAIILADFQKEASPIPEFRKRLTNTQRVKKSFVTLRAVFQTSRSLKNLFD